ncbi:hypothetical protein [Solidesulfovibrio sp.]
MKKSSWPESEKDLCAVVVRHFQSRGWTVFQEVAMGGAGGLDILCRRGPVLYAIECKRVFSDKLIEQALHWRRYAHFVSVASNARPSFFKENVCEKFGIGVLHVDSQLTHRGVYETVFDSRRPAFRRKVAPGLREHLERFHVEGLCEAGTAAGSRATPFRSTCEKLLSVVEKSGKRGIGLYEAVDRIDHHWSKPRIAYQSVRWYIEKGVIKGLRLEGSGKNARLYVAQAEGVAAA